MTSTTFPSYSREARMFEYEGEFPGRKSLPTMPRVRRVVELTEMVCGFCENTVKVDEDRICSVCFLPAR
jgi:hypothetical protein